MAAMTLTPISTEHFTVLPKCKLMVTEASDIGFRLENLYDNAEGVGFALKSHETGAVTTWVLKYTRVNTVENELLAWVLTPTQETTQQHPKLEGWLIHVVND